MPKTILVGLPEVAVRESIHRIERALANLGYQRPDGRTVINLAPADLRKDAGGFDLPIALGMLVATGQLLPEQLDDSATRRRAGPGRHRPARSRAHCRWRWPPATAASGGCSSRSSNAREAAVVEELQVFGVATLTEAVGLLSGAARVRTGRQPAWTTSTRS